ncbi:hypothetical protein EW146_g8801 [Bondarzewia mesenterica]|uniref:glucan 1,3-beta-glucosidase n=1 Tax=Bondarzewia mesenterica TaxID=1095465 RepID=A0A4S4LD67_9AGAM|nr:hypothetical protein EW146_g8801 [Bondarzewia mesenterica]
MADRPLSEVPTEYATPLHAPFHLPNDDTDIPPYLQPGPSLSTFQRERDSYANNNTPRDSYAPANDLTSPDNSTPFLSDPERPSENNSLSLGIKKAEPTTVLVSSGRTPLYKRPLFWLAAAIALVALVLAIVLPVYFVVVKPHHSSSNNVDTSSGSGGGGTVGGGTGNPASPKGATSGGDGSTVVMSNGQTFTYRNQFGGYWVYDPQDPFNTNARPNAWTPPLNTSWTWGADRVYGVNLGGLFVLEPFISPALYQKYPGAVDEWTLSELMAADNSTGGGLQAQLEAHYDTFITEQDLAQIAGAGLNWIRLPIPYWAIETWDGEPFLPKVCWKYILRVFEWARKYGAADLP